MKKLGWLALLPFLAICGTGLPQDKGAIELKVVKYDDLKEVIHKNRGKVVVVDFWGIN